MATLEEIQAAIEARRVIEEANAGEFYNGGNSNFNSAVSANSDVAANTAARHSALTVADSAEIDLTLSGQQLTATLNAASVVFAKMQNISTQRIVGRGTASTGSMEQLSVAAPLEFSGTTLTINQTTVDTSTMDLIKTLAKVVVTQFDKVNATLANITGLSFNVSASGKYAFKAVLFYDADATGGHKYAIAGTATATSIVYNINSIENASNLFVINSRKTALAGAASQVGSVAGITYIEGVIVVNQAGTLTVQFAQDSANNTSSILVGSTFQLIPIA